jgi:hypothetical protein
MSEEYQDQNQNLDSQPNGQQFTEQQQQQPTDQIQESDQAMLEGIRKAVSKNMGGKRERGSKRLNNYQKAQRVNPRFKSPVRQRSGRIR